MPELILRPSLVSVQLPQQLLELAKEHGSRMIDATELTHLCGCLVLSPPEDDEIVVEIGTFVGSTAAFLARALWALGDIHRPVVSVDPFERLPAEKLNAQGRYQEYLSTIKRYGVEDVCMPLVTLSEYAAAATPNRIRLLIVDGSHEYEGAIRDLTLYAPKVVAGGMIFLDDYSQAYPGVRRAVDEYFTPERPWTVLHKSYFVVAQKQGSGEEKHSAPRPPYVVSRILRDKRADSYRSTWTYRASSQVAEQDDGLRCDIVGSSDTAGGQYGGVAFPVTAPRAVRLEVTFLEPQNIQILYIDGYSAATLKRRPLRPDIRWEWHVTKTAPLPAGRSAIRLAAGQASGHFRLSETGDASRIVQTDVFVRIAPGSRAGFILHEVEVASER